MIRKAMYAGSFYAGRESSLIESIKDCFNSPFGPQKLPIEKSYSDIIAPYFLVPHAGYMYSGPVAACSYLELSKYKSPETVVIFSPNHTGMGSEISVPEKVESWETPLGKVGINHQLIEKIIDMNSQVRRNDVAHVREHSIEVQLPFLQFIIEEPFEIVPVTMLNQGYDASMLLGETIGKLVKNENIVVIASSDLTHYETHDSASDKDNKILEAVGKMDVKEMYDLKYKLNVSMCGYGPIAATIEAAKQTSRNQGKILKYATSGDTSGMKSQVVGYGSAMFYHENL